VLSYQWNTVDYIPAPHVTGNVLSSNAGGIYINAKCSGTYQGNTIGDNTSHGMSYSGTTPIDASNNDWGSPSGPKDTSDDRASGGLYNPGGLGDNVSDKIDYYPWVGCDIGLTATPAGLSGTSWTAAADLIWTANTEPQLNGYKVYYRTVAGTYGTPNVVGNVTSYRLTGLTNGTEYRIALASMNTVGAESAKSEEIAVTPDGTPPVGSVVINGGVTHTNSTSVTLAIAATDPNGVPSMCVSNSTSCTAWEAYATEKVWTITATDGTRTVYVKFKDAIGNTNGTAYTDTIILDRVPPETTITAKPSALSNAVAAAFEFSSSQADSTFACALDGALPSSCSSPLTLSLLVEGHHHFTVLATDPAGNPDATPASWDWDVDLSPPETWITAAPADPSPETVAVFEFSGSEAGSGFACAIDGGAFASCASPKSYATIARGIHTFEVHATDVAGNSDASPASHTWTCTGNNPPQFDPVADLLVDEGGTLTVQLVASDPDGDPITLGASNLPAGSTFDPSSGLFVWTPWNDQGGVYPDVRFEASDGSLTDTLTVTIIVNDVPLTLQDGLVAFYPFDTDVEDKSGNGHHGENHGGAFTTGFTGQGLEFSNEQGDYVEVAHTDALAPQEAVSVAAWVKLASPPETLAALVYKAGEEPAPGGTADRSYSLWATGAAGAQLTSTHEGASEQSVCATPPAALEPGTFGHVLGIVDARRHVMRTYVNGQLTAEAPYPGGSIRSGNYPLRLGGSFPTSADPGGLTGMLDEVRIYSRPLDEEEILTLAHAHPPVFTAIGDQTVAEGEHLSFQVEAADPDGDPVAYALVNPPVGASFDPGTRTFDWTPTFEQAGVYPRVRFEATDGRVTGPVEIQITVTPVNRSPVLVAVGNQAVAEGSPLGFTLHGTDDDSDGLTYGAVWLPEGATLDPATGVFSWTPGYDQAGSYDVTSTVSDGSLTDSETITITVTNMNRVPVLGTVGDKSVMEGSALQFTLTANDPDGGTLTFGATGLPAGASLDTSTGEFVWAPGYDRAGDYPVTFTVSDGSLSDSETIGIGVTNTNRAPVLDSVDDQTVTEGDTLSLSLVATDPDGDAVVFSAGGLPEGATIDPASGAFDWTPDYVQAGAYTVTFRATDDGTPPLVEEQTITITVVSPVGPIFSDDFTDGAAPTDWRRVSGTWVGTGGVYTASSLTKMNLASIVSLAPGALPLGAGVLQAKVKLTSTAGSARPNAMLLFGYQDAAHYRWVKVTSGDIQIGQTGPLGGVGGWVRKRVVTRQTIGRFALITVKILPDGWVKVYKGIATRPVLSYRFIGAGGPRVVLGGMGIGASKSKTTFDDVRVWENLGTGN
jgi:hypothetical protein